VRLSVNAVALLPDPGEAAALPAVGVPVQAVAPEPLRVIVVADGKPPPVIEIVPGYDVTAAGVKRTYRIVVLRLVPV
jgi:hypothetical protein